MQLSVFPPVWQRNKCLCSCWAIFSPVACICFYSKNSFASCSRRAWFGDRGGSWRGQGEHKCWASLWSGSEMSNVACCFLCATPITRTPVRASSSFWILCLLHGSQLVLAVSFCHLDYPGFNVNNLTRFVFLCKQQLILGAV